MNRPIFNILRAIKSEEPPCTGCKWYKRCSFNKVACVMFKNYIESGESNGDMNPTTKIYKEIYNDVRFRIAQVSYG
tara:strand:+ start:1596 stop:1823 length:228 start_codon:yes stop_codon:yes gene_type:complete